MPRCNFYLILILLGTQAFSVGCREPEEIRKYRIPKSRSDLGDIGLKKLPASPPRPAKKGPVSARMFVAIAERDKATWFFKITGPAETVDATEQQWQTILKSIRFDDNSNPDWELPEGWRLGPPKNMRFATLLSPKNDADPVEISISSLSANQDLLNNVNRWRGQLGLNSITKNELKLSTIESAAGEMKVFDAKGKLVLSGMMTPTPPRSAQKVQPQRPDLKYEIPEGWIESNQSMMVPVRLRFGSDKSAPQITVTQLLAATNQWLPNAKRWAGQVSMAHDDESLNKLTSAVEVDGIKGEKILLIPSGQESKIGMIGAMVIREDIAWFFKLIGDKQFVADNQEMFDQFMTNFKFQ